MECSEFLLTQGAGSEAMTEGLFYEMFRIFGYVLQIRDISFTTPPTKIKDFCHLPLHRGGFFRIIFHNKKFKGFLEYFNL